MAPWWKVVNVFMLNTLESVFVEEMRIFCFGRVLVFMRAEWWREKVVKIVEMSDSDRQEQWERTAERAALLSCIQKKWTKYGVKHLWDNFRVHSVHRITRRKFYVHLFLNWHCFCIAHIWAILQIGCNFRNFNNWDVSFFCQVHMGMLVILI